MWALMLAAAKSGKKFWILDPLYLALGTILAWFYEVIPSYGLAIVLLTVAVRLVLYPLTVKQTKSMQAMQRIQPEIKRLQAKYKGDRQKLNEELMKFYKENHVNPMAGCLPVILQMPLFIVLYRLILGLTHHPNPEHLPKSSAMYQALKGSGGKMVSWGMDLAQRASTVKGFGKALPFYFLVAAVVATGYYQQRQLTARTAQANPNPQAQMMGKIFPVVFGVISLQIPAGVVLYFVVSNLWQIGQQALIFRKDDGTAGAVAKEPGPGPDPPGKGGSDKARPANRRPAKGSSKPASPPARRPAPKGKGKKRK